MIKKLDYKTNILLYGPPGSGKTTLACGALLDPKSEILAALRPMALIDIDNKAEQQINLRPLVASGDLDIYPVDDPLLGGETLDFVMKPKSPLGIPMGYQNCIKIIDKVVGPEIKKEYATLILDSGTRLVQHLTSLIPAVNGKCQMDQNLWTVFGTEINNRIFRLTRLGLNVILLFHERLDKDEVSGETKVHPSVPGKSGINIASYFNEVYHLRSDVVAGESRYLMLTSLDNRYVARTSGPLNRIESQDLSAVFTKLQGKVPVTKPAQSQPAPSGGDVVHNLAPKKS